MAISSVGKTRFKLYGALLLVDIIILGLSGHINQFLEFYYKADLVPFGLALATLIWISVMIFLDVKSRNATVARPAFELTWLCITTLLWLGFNAFSTNRWKSIGWSLCKTIPDDDQYGGYRTWCKEVQALRAFIWIEWVLLLASFIYLLHFTLNKHYSGRRDVWSTSFSRFQDIQTRPPTRAASEFLQWEKFEQPQGAGQAGGQAQAPSRLDNPIDPFQGEPVYSSPYAVEQTQSRDSSVAPMGTAYARAQYAQRQNLTPNLQTEYDNTAYHAGQNANAYPQEYQQYPGGQYGQLQPGSMNGYAAGQY